MSERIKELRKAYKAARLVSDAAFEIYEAAFNAAKSTKASADAWVATKAAYAAAIDATHNAKAALEAAEKEMTDEQS